MNVMNYFINFIYLIKSTSAWMLKKTVSGRSPSVFNTTQSTLRLKFNVQFKQTLGRADNLEIFLVIKNQEFSNRACEIISL